jgi:hypothetical protein
MPSGSVKRPPKPDEPANSPKPAPRKLSFICAKIAAESRCQFATEVQKWPM